jgi:hypothetical protein
MIAMAWASEAGGFPWTPWYCFDVVPYPERMAATPLMNSVPEVYVVTRCGYLYVRRQIVEGTFNAWSHWTTFSLPSARSFVTDVALAVSDERVNHVYVADRGSVFMRHRDGLGPYDPFSDWYELGFSDARVVAAGRRNDGRQTVFVLDAGGRPFERVQRSADLGAPFDPPVDFGAVDVPAFIDIEAAHETQPLDVIAVDVQGVLWHRREDGSGAYSPWSSWPGPAPPERLVTIAASATRSVDAFPLLVFGVGESGAIYRSIRVYDEWGPWLAQP